MRMDIFYQLHKIFATDIPLVELNLIYKKNQVLGNVRAVYMKGGPQDDGEIGKFVFSGLSGQRRP